MKNFKEILQKAAMAGALLGLGGCSAPKDSPEAKIEAKIKVLNEKFDLRGNSVFTGDNGGARAVLSEGQAEKLSGALDTCPAQVENETGGTTIKIQMNGRLLSVSRGELDSVTTDMLETNIPRRAGNYIKFGKEICWKR